MPKVDFSFKLSSLTPQKTNMTLENPPFSIGNTSSNKWWILNFLMLVFRSVYIVKRASDSTPHPPLGNYGGLFPLRYELVAMLLDEKFSAGSSEGEAGQSGVLFAVGSFRFLFFSE